MWWLSFLEKKTHAVSAGGETAFKFTVFHFGLPFKYGNLSAYPNILWCRNQTIRWTVVCPNLLAKLTIRKEFPHEQEPRILLIPLPNGF